MQGPAMPVRIADMTNRAGATTVNGAVLAMSMVMEDKNYSAWVASEKRDSIFHSFGWFLLVNLLVSLFLFFIVFVQPITIQARISCRMRRQSSRYRWCRPWRI